MLGLAGGAGGGDHQRCRLGVRVVPFPQQVEDLGGGALHRVEAAHGEPRYACENPCPWQPLTSGWPAPGPAPCPPRWPRCSPARRSPAHEDAAVWWKALLALVVALALQVGVNYANDYSDGVRGTDADRVGPLRLVGSGAADAAAVKRAAFLAFGVAAVAGLVLAADLGLVAGARRGGVRRGGLVLHRRPLALRLPRPGRGDGVRLLRARRGRRHDVRPDRHRPARRAGTPPPASARSPARSWSPTTCATSPPTARSASAPWPWCSAASRPATSSASSWPPR